MAESKHDQIADGLVRDGNRGDGWEREDIKRGWGGRKGYESRNNKEEFICLNIICIELYHNRKMN